MRSIFPAAVGKRDWTFPGQLRNKSAQSRGPPWGGKAGLQPGCKSAVSWLTMSLLTTTSLVFSWNGTSPVSLMRHIPGSVGCQYLGHQGNACGGLLFWDSELSYNKDYPATTLRKEKAWFNALNECNSATKMRI